MSYSNRISDRIVLALELAVAQEDKELATLLGRAVELSMTRNSGGADFVERRTLDDEVSELLSKVRAL